ncbi:hypothetical protein WA588_000087 [Blastocystis sp. NMH]
MAPIRKVKIVKKKTTSFPRFQADKFKRMNQHWRKPKGIDGRCRRRFRGATLMPNIGYGSNAVTKYMLPNGLYKFVVSNVKDLELLMMHNTTYCAQIAHNVSAKKRAEIVKRADELSIRVINKDARLAKVEVDAE